MTMKIVLFAFLATAAAITPVYENVVDFDSIDENKDNAISFSEFQKWFENHKQSQRARNIVFLFKSYDLNSDDRLSIAEFVPLAYEINRQPGNNRDGFFKFLDLDKNGLLTRKEIEQSNEHLGPEIVDGLFTVADANNDGRITYEEFEKIEEAFGGSSDSSKKIGIARSLLESMDSNGDKHLTEREVYAFVNQFNKVSDRAVTNAFQQLDTNRDGFLVLEEIEPFPQRIIELAGFQQTPSV